MWLTLALQELHQFEAGRISQGAEDRCLLICILLKCRVF